MGCCVSTTAKSAAKNPQHENRNSKQNRAPPPSNPLPEEESVKEVLSETPSVPKKPTILRTHQENNLQKKIKPLSPNVPKIPDEKHNNNGVFKKPITIFNSEELSQEASEICSTHSGRSVSTATYCTEKNDDDGQGSFRQRSFNGDSRRERVVGKSPAKRSDPSPGRVRSGSWRDARGLGANGLKGDSGESSGRRSRSPVKRAEGGGTRTGPVRSGSAKKGGKSPGRVKSEMCDKIRKAEDFSSSNRECRENKWPPTSNESLENPLVSLECFIFL